MTTESRAHTAEEAQKMFLDQARSIARYWANLQGKTPRERCEGVVFSMLVMIDGGSAGLPAFDLVACPHPDDEKFHREEGENFWQDGMAINSNTQLHEQFHER
jgi:hypothetical protein